MSNRLSETQAVILSGAAARDDGTVLPLPESLNLRGSAADKVFKSLLKKGLVEERPAAPTDEAWREAEDGQRLVLAITPAGFEAIGAGAEDTTGPVETPKKGKSQRAKNGHARSTASPPETRPGTKQSLLIDLLKRDTGATIPEISAATNWQHHSVRGAISGALKKKLGLEVTSAVEEGRGRVYRILGGPTTAGTK